MSLLLSDPRPLATPVAESRPEARRWGVTPVLRSQPGQPTLDLRPAADPLVPAPPSALDGSLPGLPDARSWSVALAVRLLEVVSGRRPSTQLSRWVTEDTLERLAGGLPRRRARSGSAPALQSVHVQLPRPGVAEVSVHGRLGPRSVAIAVRLEAQHTRWLCTALELPPLR